MDPIQSFRSAIDIGTLYGWYEFSGGRLASA